MAREEGIIASAESVSRLDDLLRFEEIALAAWPKDGNGAGRQEQANRIMALKSARSALAKGLVATRPEA